MRKGLLLLGKMQCGRIEVEDYFGRTERYQDPQAQNQD